VYDSESGLHYNYFRDYEAGRGGYIESDPIGLDGGISTYGYVYSSPLRWVDVYGLKGPLITSVDTVCARDPILCAEVGRGAAATAAVVGAANSSDTCCTKYTNVYVSNPKHRKKRYYNSKGQSIARHPTNGQAGLSNSVTVGEGNRRVGYDPLNEELTVFPFESQDE
jgi:RHS repeat-associated protein